MSGYGDVVVIEYCVGKGDFGDVDVGCGGFMVVFIYMLGNFFWYMFMRLVVGFGLDLLWRGLFGCGCILVNDVGFILRSCMWFWFDFGGFGGFFVFICGWNFLFIGWSLVCYW